MSGRQVCALRLSAGALPIRRFRVSNPSRRQVRFLGGGYGEGGEAVKTRQEIVDGIMLPIEENARHPERAYSIHERFDGTTFELWCGWGDEGTDQVAIAKDIRIKLEERISVAE